MSDIKEVDLKKIAQQLVDLKVFQVNELLTVLKEEHGIEPSSVAPVVVSSNAKEGEVKEEKTEFDVILQSVGDKRMDVFKALKDITGLALMGCRKIVDSVPSEVKKNVAKAQAEDIKAQLESLGATVVLK